jgi:hypothetical protein
MAGYTVWGHRQRIEATFERASRVADAEVQADLARFLVVLTSGYLEQAVVYLYSDFARRNQGSPRVLRYVERRLDGFQNPNTQKLIALAGDFDADWRDKLETFLVDERKDHVDSVVANRNLIAHGESVGVTYRRASDFFKSVDAVVRFVETMCA